MYCSLSWKNLNFLRAVMINIYLDTTGSMTELGKDSALIYTAKSIQDYCDFKKIQTIFYSLDGTKIEKLNLISFSGKVVSFNADRIQSNSILISDGLFDISEHNIFDLSIALGVDADILRLQQISRKVYECDNVISAIEYMVFRDSMVFSENIEDDEDEW